MFSQMLGILWTKHVSYERILKQIETRKTLYLQSQRVISNFSGYIMKKGGIENSTLTGDIEGKRIESSCKLMICFCE